MSYYNRIFLETMTPQESVQRYDYFGQKQLFLDVQKGAINHDPCRTNRGKEPYESRGVRTV
jgi:hypothetical protein